MTEGFIKDMATWLHQNKAEIVEGFEGCLIDNALYECKNGIAYVFEKYRNSCSSDYYMYFFRNNECGSADYMEIDNLFYDLMEKTLEEA